MKPSLNSLTLSMGQIYGKSVIQHRFIRVYIFNDLFYRNVCTEAGLFAIRSEREFVIQEDFMKAVRKVADNKKLESKLDYKPV